MLLDICKDPDILTIISIARTIITIMDVFLPVIAIIMASFTIVQTVASSNQDKNKENIGNLVKKLVMMSIAFLIPVIISYLSGILNTRFDYDTCWNNATTTYINKRRLDLAKTAVAKAQRSQKRVDLDEAAVLVNKLEDGKIKTQYKKQLDELDKAIKEKEAALAGGSHLDKDVTEIKDKDKNNTDKTDNTPGNTDTDNKSDGTDLNGDGKVTGEDVVIFAKRYIGLPYIYGAKDLNKSVDCSGFTQQVYKHFGISLYRTAHEQANNGKAVSGISNAKLGDIVVMNGGGHVGIYVGDGKKIHANGEPRCPNSSKTACKVRVDNLKTSSIYKIRRIIEW